MKNDYSNLYHSFFLQKKNCLRNGIPPSWAFRGRDPVTLGVEETPDLGEVTVSLDEIVEHGWLAEERVTAVENPL